MAKKESCSRCKMTFSDESRLLRHAKKAHPPKRRMDPAPSADFNHAYFPL